jgi:hypothetical protein
MADGGMERKGVREVRSAHEDMPESMAMASELQEAARLTSENKYLHIAPSNPLHPAKSRHFGSSES